MRHEVLDASQRPLGHQLRPRDRAGLADARQVVALEVDDHHVLGGVLLGLREPHASRRPRALDRHRPHSLSPAREKELGRGRDDGPAVADERTPVQRPQRREPRGQARRIAPKRRREMLDEVHLVHVATRDRLAHGVDGRRMLGGRPGVLPLADREAVRQQLPPRPSGRIRTAAGGNGHGSGGEGSRPRRSALESPYPR